VTLDDIDLPKGYPLADAAQLIETCAGAEALRVSQRTTLAQYPGSIHWRFKRGKESGTLEVTLLNRERRILLAVPENRAGAWTEAVLERLSDEMRRQLEPGGTSR
jgi:hypothetical protein